MTFCFSGIYHGKNITSMRADVLFLHRERMSTCTYKDVLLKSTKGCFLELQQNKELRGAVRITLDAELIYINLSKDHAVMAQII